MSALARSNDTLRDLIEVGAFFGFVGGVAAWLLVLAWAAISRLWRPPLPFRETLTLHLAYVLVYAVVGAVIGVLWPTRSGIVGRLVTCLLATATGALTIFSVSHGAAWRWPPSLWARWALVAVLFAFVFGWPGRAR